MNQVKISELQSIVPSLKFNFVPIPQSLESIVLDYVMEEGSIDMDTIDNCINLWFVYSNESDLNKLLNLNRDVMIQLDDVLVFVSVTNWNNELVNIPSNWIN